MKAKKTKTNQMSIFDVIPDVKVSAAIKIKKEPVKYIFGGVNLKGKDFTEAFLTEKKDVVLVEKKSAVVAGKKRVIYNCDNGSQKWTFFRVQSLYNYLTSKGVILTTEEK